MNLISIEERNAHKRSREAELKAVKVKLEVSFMDLSIGVIESLGQENFFEALSTWSAETLHLKIFAISKVKNWEETEWLYESYPTEPARDLSEWRTITLGKMIISDSDSMNILSEVSNGVFNRTTFFPDKVRRDQICGEWLVHGVLDNGDYIQIDASYDENSVPSNPNEGAEHLGQWVEHILSLIRKHYQMLEKFRKIRVFYEDIEFNHVAGIVEKFGADQLSHREKEILQFLLQGHSVKETARLSGITPGTVTLHRKHIFRKLGFSSGYELFGALLEEILSKGVSRDE